MPTENSILIAVIIALRQWQSPFCSQNADPLQKVQEAILGKGEVCHLQLLKKYEEIC
jgi:hypothetical protein